MEEQVKTSERRGFIRKLIGLGGAGMVLGLLQGNVGVPKVEAANGDPLKIGQENVGTLMTTLTSSIQNAITLLVSNTGNGSMAVQGWAKGTGSTYGVKGEASSPSGTGVYGLATASTGSNTGVWGSSQSSNGVGVDGSGKIGVSARCTRTGGVALQCSGDALPRDDNTYNCGDNGKRWKLVRAKTVTSGDLVFENGYRFTEDEHSGLLLLNQKGERIARFDGQGNLHIKGKVMQDL